MLEGMDVVLITKEEVGKDIFGAPIYRDVEEVVENVLVAPTTADDVIDPTELNGKKLVYTLGIPKKDTHRWIDCEVRFFGMTFKSFGLPTQGIDELIPGEWNKKVLVELYA